MSNFRSHFSFSHAKIQTAGTQRQEFSLPARKVKMFTVKNLTFPPGLRSSVTLAENQRVDWNCDAFIAKKRWITNASNKNTSKQWWMGEAKLLRTF